MMEIALLVGDPAFETALTLRSKPAWANGKGAMAVETAATRA